MTRWVGLSRRWTRSESQSARSSAFRSCRTRRWACARATCWKTTTVPVIAKHPGFLGIGAQPKLDHRYLNEDVGYGLVFMSALGKQIDVPTPGIDAVIDVTLDSDGP